MQTVAIFILYLCKMNLKDRIQAPLTTSLLWLMTIGACLVVANNYYNQPLLGDIAREFAMSESVANRVATITIFGYAMGLMLLVPLGDKFDKKLLIGIDFIFIIGSLVAFGLSTSITMLMVSGFVIGFSSVVPQMFVPLVAQLSDTENRNKNIGIVMGGLLIGILGSRTVSGILNQYLESWRNVYFIAAGAMFVLWLFILILLPRITPTFFGKYKELWMSILTLIKERPDLRIAALRGGLSLASFQAFWTTLTFFLERPPYSVGSDIAGLLGLVGIGGALSASYVGKIAGKVSNSTLILISTLLMIGAWLLFGFWGFSYVGLILGIFILDVGLQSLHVTNQTIIFSKNPEATNRLNTVYMTSYFVSGSLGAFIGGRAWESFGWNGVVATGLFFVVVLLVIHLLWHKKS